MRQSILLILLATFLVQCHYSDDRFFKIYCSSDTIKGSHLFIQNKDLGEIPVLPAATADSIKSRYTKGLTVALFSGEYTLIQKDQQGNVIDTANIVLNADDYKISVKNHPEKFNLHAIQKTEGKRSSLSYLYIITSIFAEHK